MGVRDVLGRLRGALRRKKGSEEVGDGVSSTSSADKLKMPITHPGSILVHADSGVKTITRAEMQRSADDQELSIFFKKLPLELRRQIYREVWRTYLKSRRVSPSSPGSDLRLHIYTDGSGRGTFRHTQCKIHPGAPGQDDAQVIEPWPFDGSNDHMPPRWFWFAWVMRIRWDKHWKCQHAIMKRWDPRTGSAKEADSSPFLPLFLTCKKMYWESIVSLFENVTPVFTSSEDAHRFFMQKPHPFLGSIRSLEFSFTHQNDHLFLAQVQRDTSDVVKGHVSAAAGAITSDHACMVMPNRLEVFGLQLWTELVQGVQAATPDLRDFDITIGGRMAHNKALLKFGFQAGDTEAEPGTSKPSELPATWTLPGKLAVFFKTDERRYIQDGGKMVPRS